jgi:hypothetical protein
MMTQGCIDFQGRGEGQTFARARVQAMGDGVQPAQRLSRQVGALGQVLVQQSIGDFSGAASRRAVRIGTKHLGRESLHQGADGRTIASPFEEVAFPV